MGKVLDDSCLVRCIDDQSNWSEISHGGKDLFL